uniref:Uncharacterized protein n=1 Tax=Arundo donax TaxID=35708 RepID=A0A0A9HUB5_ARUDO
MTGRHTDKPHLKGTKVSHKPQLIQFLICKPIKSFTAYNSILMLLLRKECMLP